MEGELIAIIDIASSSKTENNSTVGRGGAYTGFIYTGIIPIHQIRVGDGYDADSGNADNADNSIVS